jgi:hypothetical protein
MSGKHRNGGSGGGDRGRDQWFRELEALRSDVGARPAMPRWGKKARVKVDRKTGVVYS